MNKLFLSVCFVIGVSMMSQASEKNWSVNFEGGTFLAEPDVSVNGTHSVTADLGTDKQSEIHISLEYNLNEKFSVFAGLTNGIDINGWFDTSDLMYDISYDISGYGVIVGGKIDLYKGLFLRAGIGMQKNEAEYDLDQYTRQGGTNTRSIEAGVSTDVDDSTIADIAIGYQFFPEETFSLGLTLGYRYMNDITATLPMGCEVTVNNSNPYAALNCSINW